MRDPLRAKAEQAVSGTGTLLALAQSQVSTWMCHSPSESFCHRGDSEGGVNVKCYPQSPALHGSLIGPFRWNFLWKERLVMGFLGP